MLREVGVHLAPIPLHVRGRPAYLITYKHGVWTVSGGPKSPNWGDGGRQWGPPPPQSDSPTSPTSVCLRIRVIPCVLYDLIARLLCDVVFRCSRMTYCCRHVNPPPSSNSPQCPSTCVSAPPVFDCPAGAAPVVEFNNGCSRRQACVQSLLDMERDVITPHFVCVCLAAALALRYVSLV